MSRSASAETGNLLTLFDPALPTERVSEAHRGSRARGCARPPPDDAAAAPDWHARPAAEVVAALRNVGDRRA